MYAGEVPDSGMRPEHPDPTNNPCLNVRLADFLWKAGLEGWNVQLTLEMGTTLSGQIGKHWLGDTKIPVGPILVPFGVILSVEMPVPAGKKEMIA